MVSTRRFGRLGNELFQYAAVLGYAFKHGLEWSIPRRSNDPVWNPTHFPDLFNQLWQEGREDVLLNEIWNSEQHYQEIPFKEEWRNSQIVLNGYWQSYKYFDFCRGYVVNTFGYKWELNEGVCGIHVRRGDYLLYPTKHPVVTTEYIFTAVKLMIEKGYRRFMFFSDDIQWCKSIDADKVFPNCFFSYSEGKNETEDLVAMSCCASQIISNSTMSWWAAELNRNADKTVIAPSEKNWFGPDNPYKVSDLYRPEVIQIEY